MVLLTRKYHLIKIRKKTHFFPLHKNSIKNSGKSFFSDSCHLTITYISAERRDFRYSGPNLAQKGFDNVIIQQDAKSCLYQLYGRNRVFLYIVPSGTYPKIKFQILVSPVFLSLFELHIRVYFCDLSLVPKKNVLYNFFATLPKR